MRGEALSTVDVKGSDGGCVIDDNTIIEVQTIMCDVLTINIVTGKDYFLRKRIIMSVIQNYWLMR